jgi:hypothetical protein
MLVIGGHSYLDRLSVLKVQSGMSVGLRMSPLYMLFVIYYAITFCETVSRASRQLQPNRGSRRLTERIAEVCSLL